MDTFKLIVKHWKFKTLGNIKIQFLQVKTLEMTGEDTIFITRMCLGFLEWSKNIIALA